MEKNKDRKVRKKEGRGGESDVKYRKREKGSGEGSWEAERVQSENER